MQLSPQRNFTLLISCSHKRCFQASGNVVFYILNSILSTWRQQNEMQTVKYHQRNVDFYHEAVVWSCVSVFLIHDNPIFCYFLLCFWSPPPPEENIWLFSCWTLHLTVFGSLSLRPRVHIVFYFSELQRLFIMMSRFKRKKKKCLTYSRGCQDIVFMDKTTTQRFSA